MKTRTNLTRIVSPRLVASELENGHQLNDIDAEVRHVIDVVNHALKVTRVVCKKEKKS
jgi:hypothetical protein